MPCLSGKYDPAIGAIINIGVIQAGIITPGVKSAGEIKIFPALLDTGATVTCISPEVARVLGIQPIGMQPMVSANQAKPANMYLVDLVLPFGTSGFVMQNAKVMEFTPFGSAPFQMLMGRDIICKGALTLTFDGHYSFSL
jgi:hypothetical protein